MGALLPQPDPAERLGGPMRSHEVRVHPFFWGLDWTLLEKRQMTAPHAQVCRARAVAVTENPALRLPPLPTLLDGKAPLDVAAGEPPAPASREATVHTETWESPEGVDVFGSESCSSPAAPRASG